jgi:hypothetical protein
MEPQLPSPSHAPEGGPAHFKGGESFPNIPTPEQAPAQPERHETREQHQDGPSGDPGAVVQATPVAPPLPTISSQPAQEPATSPVNTNPTYAADDDLIEKEWVEKARKVIAETKHDPHLQEAEVSKLQADYLQKRYGKTVKLPSDG